jgi:hypothetical protein
MPEVIKKLRAVGHDVAGLHSKPWHLFTGPGAPQLDFVIGLCDMLDGQTCPDFGDKAVTASWSLPDPAKFTGEGAERAALLNELYAGCTAASLFSPICRSRNSTAWPCANGSMRSGKGRSRPLCRHSGERGWRLASMAWAGSGGSPCGQPSAQWIVRRTIRAAATGSISCMSTN